jgi:AraC family ethanolamine operon transcriptional activator
MEPVLAKVESADFEEMRETLTGWDHRYSQLDDGAFEGSVLFSQLDKLQISRNKWGRKLHYQGTSPRDTFGLALTLDQKNNARWMGVEASRNDVIVQRPGAEADYISSERWDALVITIPKDVFKQVAFDITGIESNILPKMHGVAPLSPDAHDRLSRFGLEYFRILDQSIKRSATSELLAPMAQSITHMLITELVRDNGSRVGKPSMSRARKIVRFSEDYVRNSKERPLKMGDICHALHISERTLYYAFRQAVDMTPTHWLRIHRLNHVHCDLRNSDPKNSLVKQIALRHGFVHMGNLSQNYRRLFGETPSCTLQR